MNKIVLFTLLILSTIKSFALDFFVWKINKNSPSIIMPKLEGKTKEESVKAYLLAIAENKQISDLFQIAKSEGDPGVRLGKESDYVYEDIDLNFFKNKNVNFLIVTNKFEDIFPAGNDSSSTLEAPNNRVKNIKARLLEKDAESYLLPPLHDINLNARTGKQFRNILIQNFDAQLVLGGADIDPYLYGEQKTHAKSFNRKRDVSELKFVRQYIETERGMSFGFCRGHQMCAVANHQKLVQDIQIEKGASDIHLNGNHIVDIDKSSEVFSVFNKDQLFVNSLHHQSVYLVDDTKYKVIAQSTDSSPIVEALEFKNSKGYTFQFHPEIMFDETGSSIIENMVEIAKKNKKIILEEEKSISTSCNRMIKSFFNI